MSLGIPFVGIAGLVCVASLIAGFVLLLKSKQGRAVVMTVFAIACLAAVGLFWLRESRTSMDGYALDPVSVLPTRPAARIGHETATAMRRPGDTLFDADVYPSVQSAALALMREMLPELTAELPPGVRPELHLSTDELLADQASALALAFERSFPACAVELARGEGGSVATAPAGHSARQIDARVSLVSRSDGRTGTVQVTVRGSQSHSTRQARYVDKSWVDDVAAFMDRPENRGRFLKVVGSRDANSTREAAEAEAIEFAVADLIEPIAHQWAAYRQASSVGLNARTDREWLKGELRTALRGMHEYAGEPGGRGPLIVDRFVQQTDRPYGRLWRVSLLVDESPELLRSVAASLEHRANVEVRAERSRWLRMGLSTGGLLAVILLVYAFLNAATKGYYTWALRGVAAVGVAVGLLVVLKLA